MTAVTPSRSVDFLLLRASIPQISDQVYDMGRNEASCDILGPPAHEKGQSSAATVSYMSKDMAEGGGSTWKQ